MLAHLLMLPDSTVGHFQNLLSRSRFFGGAR